MPESCALPFKVVLERDGMVVALCHTREQAERHQRMIMIPTRIVEDDD